MINKLFLIFIDGAMGSGKTTTSKLLVEKLQGTARIALADVKRFIPGYGSDQRFSQVSQDVIKRMTDEYLSQGISVIVECIAKDNGVVEYQNIANTYNAKFLGYKLSTSKEVLIDRIQERTREMMRVDVLPQNKVNELDELFQPNYLFHQEHGNKHTIKVDTETFNPEEVVNKIVEDLNQE